MPDLVHSREPVWAPEPRIPSAGTPGGRALMAFIGLIAIVTILYFGRDVLIPITLAMLLSFVLSPLVELLRRIRLGRIFSVVIAVLLALGIMLALGSAIGTQVAQLARDIPQYQTTIENKIAGVRDATIGRFSQSIENLGHEFLPANRSATPTPQAPAGAQQETPQQKPIPVEVTQPSISALKIGETVIAPILSPIATAGIILVVAIFTLLQKEDLRDRAIRLFGSGDLERTTAAMNDAGRRLTRYFLTQLGINTSFGVIVAVGLYFIGVPHPVLWGILGALLRFIPYIGSWIAAILPVALAAAVAPGWSMAIWTAALYIVTELVMGQLVEPLVYGHSTGLSPIAVIFAAIFWTWLWGPIGLIISTPITLCVVVLSRYIEHLEFLDVLLGDRPALTPVESFYQRMLAGDPEEIEEQAERYLKEQPLSSYYDEVALQGLQLAAKDVMRGTLARSKIDQFRESVVELVHDLDRYGDAPPLADEKPSAAEASVAGHQSASAEGSSATAIDRSRLASAWRGEVPILCVAGRGPLDEAASDMLAQLLGKHGLPARVVPHGAVSRANVHQLDSAGVAMVCISYLDISGNPAHLRYLLRRLHEHMPEARILVGLWPAHDPILRERDLRRAIGADYCVSTLRDAVDACLRAAQDDDGSIRTLEAEGSGQ